MVPLVTIYSYSTLKRQLSLKAPKSAPAISKNEKEPKYPINSTSKKHIINASSQMPVIAAISLPDFFTAVICSKNVSMSYLLK